MKSGTWNLGFGLLALAAGASGKYALLGTGSPMALAVAGGLLSAFGVYQLWAAKGR